MLVPEEVRRSTAWVVGRATQVRVDWTACAAIAAEIAAAPEAAGWDEADHFVGARRDTLAYLLVLDTLNFCFWPDEDFEYGELARALRSVVAADPSAFAAERLETIDISRLAAWLGRPITLLDERARLLRELGRALRERWRGDPELLVASAEGSAARLATDVARWLPGFRDQAIYHGHQVSLYKRAQIFAADVWGAFGGRGIGAFDDVAALTTFADYRVPQLLRARGAVWLEPELAAQIDAGEELPAGCAAEVELRAATVQAVEGVRDALEANGSPRTAVEVDWWLWHHAEAMADELPAHHRTRTIFY